MDDVVAARVADRERQLAPLRVLADVDHRIALGRTQILNGERYGAARSGKRRHHATDLSRRSAAQAKAGFTACNHRNRSQSEFKWILTQEKVVRSFDTAAPTRLRKNIVEAFTMRMCRLFATPFTRPLVPRVRDD